ncbi:MAG: hypothetical protein H6865_03475 [Rhodospirillales bacterium]|nr:hypothetical protein [Alphaproteobacteria bacterium]MCB9986677.1 hypothetical protein [Rhodospirillales bacterium]USO06796.1 MAG: hypothetical protein H6866_04910 [Rhodospirillales bacterium]
MSVLRNFAIAAGFAAGLTGAAQAQTARTVNGDSAKLSIGAECSALPGSFASAKGRKSTTGIVCGGVADLKVYPFQKAPNAYLVGSVNAGATVRDVVTTGTEAGGKAKYKATTSFIRAGAKVGVGIKHEIASNMRVYGQVAVGPEFQHQSSKISVDYGPRNIPMNQKWDILMAEAEVRVGIEANFGNLAAGAFVGGAFGTEVPKINLKDMKRNGGGLIFGLNLGGRFETGLSYGTPRP